MSAVANHRRPHMFVRLSSHAMVPPMSTANTIAPTAIISVLPSGRQKMVADSGEANTRWK